MLRSLIWMFECYDHCSVCVQAVRQMCHGLLNIAQVKPSAYVLSNELQRLPWQSRQGLYGAVLDRLELKQSPTELLCKAGFVHG